MSAQIQLRERLGLSDAAPLARQILAEKGSDLVIDASRVSHIGSLCQQVLLAAAKEWQEDQRTFRMCNPTDACVQDLALCGLTPESFEGEVA
ncbi:MULTISPECIES: STAS domain-containing protein [Halocynthiibacter]|uniref:STAS domain-containing protein n=1 Tax=Halocynthiibacter halioticoli TaxID=2986804 RepID=A0AAE3IZD6_9RHOB|nr:MULTISPECIES: STAS domain-containing protein [Halocynthiibacter]MCV6824479.1 STAS domain-containing protein [Halocynthiibacter halioticoli]MCW4057480.1 STAS domain-containing protein [Halocynthiibacter sp. SDUM655004]MDE0589483.1 STAS domain-containing protein [Halocynthiibacter sp. C4]